MPACTKPIGATPVKVFLKKPLPDEQGSSGKARTFTPQLYKAPAGMNFTTKHLFQIEVIMKALSVQQPFAFEIMNGLKTIEVRSWDTLHRGDLLICSSQKPAFSREEMEEIEDDYDCTLIYGHAICLASLTDVRPVKRGDEEPAIMEEIDPDAYAWVLENARPVVPFPVKGQQGLFNVEDALITVSPFKCNEPVKAKKGVRSQDFGIDLSGWQCRTGHLILMEEEEGEARIHVIWDSASLRRIPIEMVRECEQEGFDWTGMLLRLSEIEKAEARDTPEDVENMIDKIMEDFHGA